MTDTADAAAVRAVVHAINDAWTGGHAAQLAELFGPEMQIVSPELDVLADGRDAAVASYVHFAATATIGQFDMADPRVHLAGDTAVAAYGYRLAYETEGEELLDEGRDVFVLARRDGRWRAVWRMLLPGG